MRFTIESVTDLQWRNENHTGILCQVKFSEFENILPFCAMPTDVEEHGRFIFNQAVNGAYGAIGDYIPTPETVTQPIVVGAQTL